MEALDYSNCNEEELWKYVAYHLARHDISSVLVGGAVVAIYSEGLYRSGDLDLITYELSKDQLDVAFAEIGFKKRGMSYQHPECKHLYVQVVAGPLGIGDDHNITPDVHTVAGEKIQIYSPTDCIRDRLSAYLYDKSRDCFDQALLVAKKCPYDLEKLKKWLAQEKAEQVYDEFLQALKN